ncbi:hypothetical protein [Petrachloros mirabilis]
METIEALARQQADKFEPVNACGHQRLIDDVLTRGGKRTGKVRCLECDVVFDDPYHGLR